MRGDGLHKPRWTDAEDEKLIRLLPNASFSEIAKELGPGFTRNMVAGRVWRLGLTKDEAADA